MDDGEARQLAFLLCRAGANEPVTAAMHALVLAAAQEIERYGYRLRLEFVGFDDTMKGLNE